MFQVVTVNLATDAAAADIAHGTASLGELTAGELATLLERFRRLDPVQNHDTDPRILITVPSGQYRIRTGQGKLFLDTPRNSAQPYSELTAEEIIRFLKRPPTESDPDEPLETPAKGGASNFAIAAAILFAGLCLNGYTIYAVSYSQTVNVQPAVTLLTDPAEISARKGDAVGTFATGNQSGDRTITIEASSRITFAEVGGHKAYSESADTIRIGRIGKDLCLKTVDNGVIEVVNIDTLVYYRDTYKRTK
jgi:hypothetical protein